MKKKKTEKKNTFAYSLRNAPTPQTYVTLGFGFRFSFCRMVVWNPRNRGFALPLSREKGVCRFVDLAACAMKPFYLVHVVSRTQANRLLQDKKLPCYETTQHGKHFKPARLSCEPKKGGLR